MDKYVEGLQLNKNLVDFKLRLLEPKQKHDLGGEQGANLELLWVSWSSAMGVKHVAKRSRWRQVGHRSPESKIFRYYVHHGGVFKDAPYRYEGGEVQVIETGDYFNEWGSFVYFMRRRGLKNIGSVSVQVSDALLGPDDVRVIWDEKSVWAAVELLMSKGEVVLFCEHCDGQSLYDPVLPHTAEEPSQNKASVAVHDEVRLLSVGDQEDNKGSGDDDDDDDELNDVEDKVVEEDERSHDGSEDDEFVGSGTEETSLSESSEAEDEMMGDGHDGYETEYLRSDDEVEVNEEGDKGDEDDEANITFRRCEFPRFVPGVSDDFVLGMRFDNKEQFKDLATAYAVKNHRDIYPHKTDKTRTEMRCVDGCPFHVWASYNRKLICFQIKVLRKTHFCNKKFELRLATAKWLAKRFMTELRDDPGMTLKDVREKVKKETKLHISKHMAKYVKKEFRKTVGSTDYEFGLLRDYASELLRTNPGSTVVLRTRETVDGVSEEFRRFYVCFDACKRGFIEGCRKIVGIDGCFLKGAMKGEILTAVGRDANDQMYPIAWAVVEVENKDSWIWFITLLRQDLGINDTDDWVIISDQQKGLLPAVHLLLPKVEHRLCARHICTNWQKSYPGDEMKILFWNVANSTNERQFKDALEVIDQYPGAKEKMLLIDPKRWVKAFFSKKVKCDSNQNNLCEAFNGVKAMLKARTKPIYSLLEDIRKYMMARFCERREFHQKWRNPFGNLILLKMEECAKHHHEWRVIFNGDYGYEVQRDLEQHAVRLDRRSCSCGEWDITGIPCVHAACAIVDRRESLMLYLDDCYKIDKFAAAYKYSFQPVGGPNVWKKVTDLPISPPTVRRMPGRPRVKRIREHDELKSGEGKKRKREADEQKSGERLSKKASSSNVCSICKNPGHNKRTCQSKDSNIGSTQPTNGTQGGATTGRPQGGGKRGGVTQFGYGVYTNISSGRMVLNPGTSGEKILHQGASTKRQKFKTRRGGMGSLSQDHHCTPQDPPSTAP